MAVSATPGILIALFVLSFSGPEPSDTDVVRLHPVGDNFGLEIVFLNIGANVRWKTEQSVPKCSLDFDRLDMHV
jgi:hypothetical protein